MGHSTYETADTIKRLTQEKRVIEKRAKFMYSEKTEKSWRFNLHIAFSSSLKYANSEIFFYSQSIRYEEKSKN